MVDMTTLSMEELEKIMNSGNEVAPATSDTNDLSKVPDWKLLEIMGENSDFDYELPSDTMYDQITGPDAEAQAQAMYDKYANSPYSEDTWKGPAYKGNYIPRPNYSLGKTVSQMGEFLGKVSLPANLIRRVAPDQGLDDNPVTVAAPQIAVDAVSDVPGEVAEFGASALDTAAKWLGFNSDMTGSVQQFQDKNIPKMRVESTSGRFTKEASQMAVGTGVAMKAMKYAGPIVKALGAISAGAITRDDQDTETLLFGEKSLLGADLKVFDEESGKEAANVLNRRLNLLADDLIVGSIAEGAIRGTAFLAKTAYGVTLGRALPYFNQNKRELKVMEHIAGMLRLADDAQTPEEQKAILSKLAGYMSEPNNQKIIYNIPDKEIADISVQLDSMSVLRRAGDATSDVTKDNAAILARKGDQIGGIAEAADNMTKNVMDAMGRDTPESAKSVIADIADSRVGEAVNAVTSEKKALTAARQDLKRRLTNDPTFGEALAKAGKQFDVLADDITYRNTEALTDNVINAFVDAQKALKGKSDAVKRAGGNINMPDMKKMTSLVNDAAENSDLARGLKTVIDRAGTKAVDWAMEVRPMLSAEISRIYKTGVKSNADANFLRTLRDEIDSQLDTLAGSDGVRKSQAGQAFQEFHTYFKEKYAPVWSDGILGDVSAELKDSPLVRFGRTDHVDTLANVDKAIADRLPEFRSARQFVQNMRGEGRDVEDIKNYIIGKAVIDVRKKVKPGADIEEFPIGLLSERLADYGSAFQQYDDELANSINTFLRDVQSGATDITQMKETIKGLEKEAIRLEDSLKGPGGTFGDFFTAAKDPDNPATRYRVTDDASEAIQSIFKDKDSAKTKIENILRETNIKGENDPTVLAGLQVSWVDALRREMIDKSTGAFNVRGSKLLLDDETVTSFLNLGEQVFKDKPELFELHKQILGDALMENQSLSKQLRSALASKSVDTDMANAAHVLTTWTFGVLNRTAARVRSGVGAYLAINKKAGSVDDIYQRLLNDPQYFSDTLLRLSDTIKTSGAMSKASKEILWDVMTRVGVPIEGASEPVDQPAQRKMFNDLLREIETELMLEDGRGATKARKERRDNK